MLEYFRKASISKTVFMVYLSVFLSFFLISGSLFSAVIFSRYTKNTNRSNIAAMNEKSEQLSTLINRYITLGNTLSSSSRLRSLISGYASQSVTEQLDTEAALKNFFNIHYMNNVELSDIAVILPGKHIAYNTDDSVIPTEYVTPRPWFSKINGLVSVLLTDDIVRVKGGYSEKALKDLPLFSFIYTIPAESPDAPHGYLYLGVSKKAVYDSILLPAKCTPASVITVLDNTGKNILGSEDFTTLPNAGKIVSTSSADSISTSFGGRRSVAHFSKANSQGWKIFQITPQRELYRELYILLAATGLAMLAFLLLCTLTLRRLSNSIAAPIVTMSKQMSSLEHSTITEPIKTPYKNEIGVLYSSYNSMLSKINQLIEETEIRTRRQKEAEIDALKVKFMALESQINPHFLYNILNTVSWKAIDKDAPEIADILSRLSKLYKSNIYKGIDFTTPEAEIAQITLYTDLQRECSGKDFAFNVSLPDELRKTPIPRFIIQPFIENIFKHSTKQLDSPLTIDISFAADGDRLSITISDNGCGMPQKVMDAYNEGRFSDSHIGIRNVAERIKLLCGSDYSITFSLNPPHGTTVKITIPEI